MSISRWLFRAKNKQEYKNLENLIDSFKENAKVVAHSNDQFFFVVEVYSNKVIDNIKSRGIYKMENQANESLN